MNNKEKKDTFNFQFKQNLYALRKLRGLDQIQVANDLDWEPWKYSRIENPNGQALKLEEAEILCDYFDVPIHFMTDTTCAKSFLITWGRFKDFIDGYATGKWTLNEVRHEIVRIVDSFKSMRYLQWQVVARELTDTPDALPRLKNRKEFIPEGDSLILTPTASSTDP